MSTSQSTMIRISIHALREESDDFRDGKRLRFFISIHALREESDPEFRYRTIWIEHFNPRPP